MIGIEPNADMRREALRKLEGHPYAAQIEYREGLAPDVKLWPKEQHLDRMRESGHFRFTREVLLHHLEQGDATRFLALMRSIELGQQSEITDREIGFDRLSRAAFELIGSQPIPWYLSYRVRIGIK